MFVARELFVVNRPDVVHRGGLVAAGWKGGVQPPPLAGAEDREGLRACHLQQEVVVRVLVEGVHLDTLQMPTERAAAGHVRGRRVGCVCRGSARRARGRMDEAKALRCVGTVSTLRGFRVRPSSL